MICKQEAADALRHRQAPRKIHIANAELHDYQSTRGSLIHAVHGGSMRSTVFEVFVPAFTYPACWTAMVILSICELSIRSKLMITPYSLLRIELSILTIMPSARIDGSFAQCQKDN
jgi:hypothetical protein